MPTSPLPLLHSLLRALDIPVLPSTLSATSPSLLLVILETLIESRLPLPQSIRRCDTFTDELAVVKCVLGVLANDLLGMDLAVIQPKHVVEGREEELAVLIMALAVVARRKKFTLRLPSPAQEDHSGLDWSDSLDQSSTTTLPRPISPDISLTQLHPLSPRRRVQEDVFGTFVESPTQVPIAALNDGVWKAIPVEKYNMDDHSDQRYGLRTRAYKAAYDHCGDPWAKFDKGRGDRKRTVLEEMMEEFGLGMASSREYNAHFLG